MMILSFATRLPRARSVCLVGASLFGSGMSRRPLKLNISIITGTVELSSCSKPFTGG